MPTTDHGLTYWTREEWGAAHGRGHTRNPNQTVDRVVVHHTEAPTTTCGAGLSREVEIVRGIERHHAAVREFLGIGYNWLVMPSGRVFEGRGWKRVGAHVNGSNSRSVGVCFVIDGDVDMLSPAAIEAWERILAAAPERERLSPEYQIGGHRDWDPEGTACPGERVYREFVLPLREPGPPPTLETGDRGREVERLQRLLGDLYDGTVDGLFGPVTRAAVEAYQTEHGLEVDGVVGPETWGALSGESDDR